MWFPLFLSLAQVPAPPPDAEGAILGAERAFLAGDWEEALSLAELVPAGSPLSGRARAIAAMAHLERGAPKEAVRTWGGLVRSSDPIYSDVALLSIAAIYAQAMTGRAVALAENQADWDRRRELGLIDSLEGPFLRGRWFAPEIPAHHAQRLLELCWLPEGEATLARAQGRADALTVLLDDHVNSSDAALWARLQAGDWGDAGLATWISLDPMLARPAALALAHASQSPEAAAPYRALALGWLRRDLDDARARVAEARETVARATLLQDGLRGRVPRSDACSALPKHGESGVLLDSHGYDPRHRYVWEPERGERWSDEVGDYVPDARSRCEGEDVFEVLGCLK